MVVITDSNDPISMYSSGSCFDVCVFTHKRNLTSNSGSLSFTLIHEFFMLLFVYV